MHFIVNFSTIIFTIAVFVDATHLEEGNSCIIQYLKSKKKLSDEFPYDVQPDSVKCRLIIPSILRQLEVAIYSKLSEKADIKVDCILAHLKNTSGLDYMLMREVVPMTKKLDNSEITQKNRNATKVLRRILINGANKCQSDKSYSGLFDDILGLQNLSLPVLQHNYCFTKYAIENKLVEVKHVNINPRRISIANVNCEEMIDALQSSKERQLLNRLNQKKFTSDHIQCIMDKYRSLKAFDSNIALEVVDFLHVSYEEKRDNRERIANQLEAYIKSVYNCAKSSPEFHHNKSEIVKIFQF